MCALLSSRYFALLLKKKTLEVLFMRVRCFFFVFIREASEAAPLGLSEERGDPAGRAKVPPDDGEAAQEGGL